MGTLRLRDLGVFIGRYPTGARNAITDVPGVTVGHSTVVHGAVGLPRGEGPARTGVTAVVPHAGDPWDEPCFAGVFTLNGTGEWTGTHFIRETGLLYGPIFMTNSHSVGTVRDAVIARECARRDELQRLPVVGETWDGLLNDISGFHVRPEHVYEALDGASADVAEGNVGAGTGTISHGFKGGIGTASRLVALIDRQYTIGVIVQANHGGRAEFEVDGVRVGELVPLTEVPLGCDADAPEDRELSANKNSILVTVATDAPLLPGQCERLAHRATLGIARNGAYAQNLSGEFALAFSTGNLNLAGFDFGEPSLQPVRVLSNSAISPLFAAVMEATQEAIVNSLLAAETTSGVGGFTAHALDAELLLECFNRTRPR